jgi:oligopeptide transport system substrate-binding protein
MRPAFRKTLAVISLVLLCATGCQKSGAQSQHSQHLRLAITTEPPQLDPRKMKDSTSGSIGRMFCEGLMRTDIAGNITYGLAESYEVDASQKRYLFTLRENLKWSDGRPLTAYDFEYSWKKILDPKFMSEYAYMLFVIENAQQVKEGSLPASNLGVNVLDERHLEITLNNPTAYFPEMTAFYTLYPVPKDIDETNEQWAQNVTESFLSCGPFQLTSWKHNSELTLVANPHYWDKENVKLSQITVSIIHDESTTLSLFENNDIDFIGVNPFATLPVDSLPLWREKGLLNKKAVATSLWYKINTTMPLLKNPKVRAALSLAIDRDSISRNVTMGTMIPSDTFLPPSMRLNHHLIPERALREKAQRLFLEGVQEEGLELSELPKLKLSLNDTELNRRIAQAIQQQWRENLGLDIAVESLEWKVYISKLHKLDYEIGRMGWVADFNDPINYLEVFKYADPLRGGNNDTGWEDSRFIHLLDQSSTASDEQTRKEFLAEAERVLVESTPVVPLFHYTVNWLQNPNLQNVCITGLGQVDFKWAGFGNPESSAKP